MDGLPNSIAEPQDNWDRCVVIFTSTRQKSSIRVMYKFLVEFDRNPSDHPDSQLNDSLCL